MRGIASTLSPEDMKNVSAFYATKQPKPGFAKNKDSVKLGEKIYRGGIPDRNVPACAGCHSPSGGGIPAQYPRLAGQHADYAEAQLVAFRAARPEQQCHDGQHCRQDERPRDQGRRRLHRRPALSDGDTRLLTG
jgi:cytochrome c553